jgi:hypothetical protein
MTPSPAPARSPSSTSALAVVVFLILICSPCLGLGGGLVYQRSLGQGQFAFWRSLAAPPEAAVAFVTADPNRVYVTTVSDQVYVCEHNGAAADRDCWLLAEEPYTIDNETDFEHSVFSGQVPPPPGETTDVVYVSIFFADAAFEARYALLADGTVWVWEYGASSNQSLLVLLAGPVVGLALGGLLVTALLVWHLTRRRAAARRG